MHTRRMERISLLKKTFCFVLCAMSLVGVATPSRAATKVFLLAGQSNMGGCGMSAELVGTLAKYSGQQPNVNFWNSGGTQWAPLSSTFGGNSSFGPEVSFGYQMHAAFPNDDIYLVKWSYGGTSLYSDWKPGDGGGWCYQTFMSIAVAAIKNLDDAHLAPTVAGMLWMQGEHDTTNASFAEAYQTNLSGFIAAMRTDFNAPDMPFVLGRILPGYGTPEYNTIVRTAQETVPTLVPHTAWVNTDDLQISSQIPLHYGTQGQIDLGLRFAGKFTSTPEPSTVLLLCTGAIALFAFVWRKQR